MIWRDRFGNLRVWRNKGQHSGKGAIKLSESRDARKKRAQLVRKLRRQCPERDEAT